MQGNPTIIIGFPRNLQILQGFLTTGKPCKDPVIPRKHLQCFTVVVVIQCFKEEEQHKESWELEHIASIWPKTSPMMLFSKKTLQISKTLTLGKLNDSWSHSTKNFYTITEGSLLMLLLGPGKSPLAKNCICKNFILCTQ